MLVENFSALYALVTGVVFYCLYFRNSGVFDSKKREVLRKVREKYGDMFCNIGVFEADIESNGTYEVRGAFDFSQLRRPHVSGIVYFDDQGDKDINIANVEKFNVYIRNFFGVSVFGYERDGNIVADEDLERIDNMLETVFKDVR